MPVEIRVPPLGESVVEATVGRWTKQEGDPVERDEVLVELETDKITVEVAAPSAGVLGRIEKQEGDTVGVNDLLGAVDESASGDGASPEDAGKKAAKPDREPKRSATEEKQAEPEAGGATRGVAGGAAAGAAEGAGAPGQRAQSSPAARAVAAEQGIDLATVKGTGPNDRITKEDVMRTLESTSSGEGRPDAAAAPAAPQKREAPPAPPAPSARPERETRERMSRRRQTIARRLVEAQQTTASLTTFNEVDLHRVMQLRKRRQDAFVKKHGLKLGFMSFFTKAAVGALKQFPRVNAEIQGDEIVLKHYYDIGIAVGTDEGLVVPVLRDADSRSFAEIERGIGELAGRARDGKLTLDELQGGTFTITNGGIYGSMLSTPILNPPQVGILGMHNIVERPVVIDGRVEIRPMMYVALTYDHRIVDGSEAVQFLVAIKQMIEDPETMLLEG